MAAPQSQQQSLLLNFFQTLTQEQLISMTALAEAHRAAAAPEIAVTTPESRLSAPRQATAAKKGKAKSKSNMIKKPVNSFMAFRKYYSPVFKGATQISKSGFVSTIWEADLKRGIWALLGEAYTDMRDHHEEVIPMDKFLALAVPLLPLIPADSYLAKMGWQLTTNSEGETELSRDPNFNAELLSAEYPSRTNLSARDISNHCYRLGLANRAHRRRKPTLRELMARERMNNTPGQTPPPACGGTLTLAVTPQTDNSTTNTTTGTGVASLLADPDSPDTITNSASPNPTAADSVTSNDYITIEAVTADQQQAFARTAAALHFHPDISPPILGFDPRVIQDDFDPFNLDLSHLVAFET